MKHQNNKLIQFEIITDRLILRYIMDNYILLSCKIE